MMANRFIYLDNHATTPMDPRVLKSMLPWMGSSFGNAHSRDHALGDQSARAVEAARAEVAGPPGCARAPVSARDPVDDIGVSRRGNRFI